MHSSFCGSNYRPFAVLYALLESIAVQALHSSHDSLRTLLSAIEDSSLIQHPGFTVLKRLLTLSTQQQIQSRLKINVEEEGCSLAGLLLSLVGKKGSEELGFQTLIQLALKLKLGLTLFRDNTRVVVMNQNQSLQCTVHRLGDQYFAQRDRSQSKASVQIMQECSTVQDLHSEVSDPPSRVRGLRGIVYNQTYLRESFEPSQRQRETVHKQLMDGRKTITTVDNRSECRQSTFAATSYAIQQSNNSNLTKCKKNKISETQFSRLSAFAPEVTIEKEPPKRLQIQEQSSVRVEAQGRLQCREAGQSLTRNTARTSKSPYRQQVRYIPSPPRVMVVEHLVAVPVPVGHVWCEGRPPLGEHNFRPFNSTLGFRESKLSAELRRCSGQRRLSRERGYRL